MLSGLQPWTLVIFVGSLIALFGGISWYMIGWRNRMFRQPDLEPQGDEGAVSGRLLDRETLELIGGRSWGKAVQRRYIPDQFPGPIKCVIHKQALLPGQFFWETPLIDKETKQPTGDNFAICCSCQPGNSPEANRA